jgi:hypothetical protein
MDQAKREGRHAALLDFLTNPDEAVISLFGVFQGFLVNGNSPRQGGSGDTTANGSVLNGGSTQERIKAL